MHRSKNLWAAGLAIAIGGCMPQVVSREPLFRQGEASLRPGLWALLAPDCARPAHAQVFDWPSCATPARLRPGELTILMPGPVRGEFLLADGTPHVVQSRLGVEDATDQGDPLGFAYYSFVPDGSGPLFTSGTVRVLRCPEDDEIPIEGMTLEGAGSNADQAEGEFEVEGLAHGERSRCEAATAEAVREAARRALVKRPEWQAVWIADLP